jgi:hypothetical protein
VVHELFRVRDRGIDEPDFKHQQETEEKEDFPAPLFFELGKGVLLPIKMICEERKERDETQLDWEPNEPAVPGQDGEEEGRARKRDRECELPKCLFQAGPECQLEESDDGKPADDRKDLLIRAQIRSLQSFLH